MEIYYQLFTKHPPYQSSEPTTKESGQGNAWLDGTRIVGGEGEKKGKPLAFDLKLLVICTAEVRQSKSELINE
jgi:hypothetical protein